MKIPIICCDYLKCHLNNKCKQEGHGWICPDNTLYLHEQNGDTYVCIPMNHDNNGVGIHNRISHCPWCGAKIKFGKKNK